MLQPYDIKQKGFTLIELLIAMVVGLIVMGALGSTFVIQQKSYAVQEQVTEMMQNARTAVDMMSREIRLAGYQVDGAAITNQGTDAITFLGDIDSDIITTIDTNPASSGDTSISVDLDDGSDSLDTTDYVYITDGTNAEFIQVDNTNPSDLSGEPDIINLSSGLTTSFAVGCDVYTAEQVTYSLNGNTLERNGVAFVDNVENLSFTYGSDTVTIQITVRTTKPDPDYAGDGYRRKTLKTVVKLRNS